MNCPFLKSLLRSRRGSLLLWVLRLGQLCSAQTPPTPQLTVRKVETASQMATRRIVDLIPSSPLKVRDVSQVPRKREIDVDASLGYKTEGQGGNSGLSLFWIGQVDLNASGYTVEIDANGTQKPLFDPQKYIWNVGPSPIIPLAPPYEANPNYLIEFGLTATRVVSSLVLDNTVGQVRPWARDLFTASLNDDQRNHAADGRPLDILKPGISTPNKHFYWDLGAPRVSSFPQTSVIDVGVTGFGEDAATYPARVKVNFQLPTRTVYDVEISLYNWVDNSEAPLADSREFWDKLSTDDEFQKEVLTDVGSKVVEVAVDYATGKVIGRIVAIAKAPAKRLAERLNEAVLRALRKPAKKLADGTTPPFPEWYKTHGVHVKVRDRAPWRLADHLDELPTDSGEEAEGDPGNDGCDEGASSQVSASAATPQASTSETNPCDHPNEEDEDSQPIEGHFLYFYTQNPDGFASDGADRWLDPNGRSLWPQGYYLTDLRPVDAARLRRGQLSFALFGHPYEWESGGTVYWVRVWYPQQDIRNMRLRSIHDPQVLNSSLYGRGVYLRSLTRDWPRAQGFAYKRRQDGTDIIDGPFQLVTQGQASFQPNTADSPGVDDIPRPADRDIPQNGDSGRWVDANGNPGARGDSGWLSNNQRIQRVTGSVPIPFRNGYPDFSQWTYYEVNLSPSPRGMQPWYGQRGTQSPTGWDFAQANRAWARDTRNHVLNPAANWLLPNGEGNASTAWTEIRRTTSVTNPTNPAQTMLRPLTWHHHHDMKTMQLVPTDLNNALTHQGGKFWAENARW